MTPIAVVATLSRLITKVTDRITGDRSDYPLLVAMVGKQALEHLGIGANIFYGPAAWVEVQEDQTPLWVGVWGDRAHIWLATEFGEVVDLCRGGQAGEQEGKYSPPLIWSKVLPKFYRYHVAGQAEIDLKREQDRKWFDVCLSEVIEKIPAKEKLLALNESDLDFPDEAILCPDRRILDDARQSFKHYDRALSIFGIPAAPNLSEM